MTTKKKLLYGTIVVSGFSMLALFLLKKSIDTALEKALGHNYDYSFNVVV